jgi:hypothetical protein
VLPDVPLSVSRASNAAYRNTRASEVKNMGLILNQTIGGMLVGTLVVGMTIVLGVVWLWSRWDHRQARKRRVNRTEEEAKMVLRRIRPPNTSVNDAPMKNHLSQLSNETLARDLYISTQMQLQYPQLPPSAYRAALEEEIRKRGYCIADMLHAADAATTRDWDKDEAWDMVRTAFERQRRG